jgi:hypothetical protein
VGCTSASTRTDRLARVEQERAAKQQERDEADAARRTEDRAALEARLKARFMANPAATLEAWERVMEQQVDDHLRREAAEADQRARREHARIYGSAF